MVSVGPGDLGGGSLVGCGMLMGQPWAPRRRLDTLEVGNPETSSHGAWGRMESGPDVCSGPAPAVLPAQLLATLLIQYERLQGVRSSGVLIIFWFLCVVCGIIPFRSKILSALTQVRGKEKPARSTAV